MRRSCSCCALVRFLDPKPRLRRTISSHRCIETKLRKRASRAKDGKHRAVQAALLKAQLNALPAFIIKHKGVITPRTRRLIRSLTEQSVPKGNVFHVVRLVLASAGIPVIGHFDRHSVRRINGEGFVHSQLQSAQEMSQATSTYGLSFPRLCPDKYYRYDDLGRWNNTQSCEL